MAGFRAGFLNLNTLMASLFLWDILGLDNIIRHAAVRTFSSISGLYSVDANGTSPPPWVVTIEMSPDIAYCSLRENAFH